MKIKNIVTVLLISLVLASCAPASKPMPTSTDTNAPLPTQTATITPEPTATFTPEPTATPVNFIEGLNNIPQPNDDFINRVVSENYLKVMGLSREQVDLVYVERNGIDGQTFIIMLDNTTGVPLAVYTGEWQKATLKFFGRQVDMLMGTDTAENLQPNDLKLYSEYEVGVVTLGMFWDSLEPQQGIINKVEENKGKQVIADLRKMGVNKYIMMHLFYPRNYPSWLLDGTFTKEQLREIMRARIRYIVDTYPEMTYIVVLNEPYQKDTLSERNDIFYRVWGDWSYVTEMFEYTRAYLAKKNMSEVKLVYNDGANEAVSSPNSRRTRMIIGMLHERELIDYVGMQMHLNQWSGAINQNGKFNRAAFLTEVKFYEQMGVPILITEMTYEPTFAFETKMSPEQFNEHLSDIFGSAISAAIESGNIHKITFWGLTDKWFKLDNINWYMIFDEKAQPKQSYYIVLKTLYEGIK